MRAHLYSGYGPDRSVQDEGQASRRAVVPPLRRFLGGRRTAGTRELCRIPTHRRPLHQALVARRVEGCRAVEDAAVVPDDEVAFLPLVAVAELGLGHVIQQ